MSSASDYGDEPSSLVEIEGFSALLSHPTSYKGGQATLTDSS